MLKSLYKKSILGALLLSSVDSTMPIGAKSCLEVVKSYARGAARYIKRSSNHFFSSNGIKDLACAYVLGMGLTAVHELGHAVTDKIFNGSPINVTLGASPDQSGKIYLQIGGMKLGGFNPATGYSDCTLSGHPLKNAAVYAAGPICGALSSMLAYVLLLRKYDELYLTKAVALYGIFNHTVGIAGVGGLWAPGSDAARFVSCIKEYFSRS